ncbi:hypothetical protein AMK22_31310 [Streptomyces sp. CB01580]|nr:hypothetical protein AMK22_31310 [Streptomyces sp. CB01580]
MRCVGLGHELPVRGAGSGEVLVSFIEFSAEVEDLLFQLGDLPGERLDVGGCAAGQSGAAASAGGAQQ